MRRSSRRRVRAPFSAASAPVTPTVGTAETTTMAGVALEWRPDEGPFTDISPWTDMTAYMTEGSISRGTQYELDRTQAGRMDVTLKTPTRLFDPEYTAGAHYGKLLPMRQIRLRATKQTATYGQFRGFITDWGQTVVDASDGMFVTTISAADALVLLEQASITFSAYSLAVQASTPDTWLRFNDTGALLDSSGNGHDGYWSGTPTLAAGVVTGDPMQGVAFDGTATARCVHGLNLGVVNQTFEFQVKTEASTGTIAHIAGSNLASLIYMVAGKLRFWTSGTSFYKESTSTINDGDDHYIVYTTDGYLYIDGVADTLSSSGPSTPAQFTGGVANGSMLIGRDVASNDPFVGTLHELAFYQSLMSSTTAAAHYEAATTAWAGDTTGERMTRIANAIGLASTLTDFDTGISTIQAFDAYGTSVLAYFQQLADTEGGRLYVDRDGVLCFRSRHDPILNRTVSQATFGDAHSSATYEYSAIALPRDEALLFNVITVSRQNGVTVTAKDAASIAKYGWRARSALTTLDESDEVVRDAAYDRLARFAEQGLRVESMTLYPQAIPTMWIPALSLELGDRWTVERTPLGTGNQIVADQFVERIEHKFRPMLWETTLTGSPTDVFDDVWIWDDSNWDDGEWAY